MEIKKKVLVVEDEESLIGVLAEKLKKEDFEVLEARNGEEGLKKALDEKPDIILLDILMPVMDGITMLKKLREDPAGTDMKVIMLTNLSDGDDIEQAVENRSTEYLIKSDWTLQDIIGIIRKRLEE